MAKVTRLEARGLAILALGWVLVLLYAWPGIMTNDCFDHLREGRAGVYTDGHPPIVAVLWRYLDKIVSGPAGMYVLQTGTFFVGLYAFFRSMYEPPRAATIAVCVALFPPVLAPMGVVWKDALMASCLVLGFAGLISSRRNVKIAALVALWFASAVRYNAAAATLAPIVLLFEWRPMKWYARYGIGIAVWIAITASSMGVNQALTDKPMYFWTSSTAVHDIVGTLAKVDETMPDDHLRALLAGTELRVDKDIHPTMRERYKRSDYMNLVLGEQRLWNLPIMGDTPAPESQRAAINSAWKKIITSHPGAYLAHRFDVFIAVLGFPRKSPGVQVQVGRGQNRLFAIPLGVDHRPYIAQDRVQRQVERLAYKTPLFRAWLYVLFALVVLWLGRRNRLVLALIGSGLMLELSLFPFAASPDYRYSHWLVLTTLIAAFVVHHAWRTGKRREARASGPTAHTVSDTPDAAAAREQRPGHGR